MQVPVEADQWASVGLARPAVTYGGLQWAPGQLAGSIHGWMGASGHAFQAVKCMVWSQRHAGSCWPAGRSRVLARYLGRLDPPLPSEPRNPATDPAVTVPYRLLAPAGPTGPGASCDKARAITPSPRLAPSQGSLRTHCFLCSLVHHRPIPPDKLRSALQACNYKSQRSNSDDSGSKAARVPIKNPMNQRFVPSSCLTVPSRP